MNASQPGWYTQPDGTMRYWDGMQWVGPPRPAWPQDAAPRPPAYGEPGHIQPYAAAGYPPPAGYAPPYGGVAPKNPGISLLASFFLPGLGSMINGEVGKGVAMLVLYVVGIPLAFVLIGIPLMFGVWIWGMIDAYTGAQNWNRRHGIWS